MTKLTWKSATKATSKGAPSNGRPLRAVPNQTATAQAKSTSKQTRVLEMLRSATGATIAALMKETGWQQHSVRGFLAGVVRKKLGLNLQSKKVDGERAYRIASGTKTKPPAANRKRRV